MKRCASLTTHFQRGGDLQRPPPLRPLRVLNQLGSKQRGHHFGPVLIVLLFSFILGNGQCRAVEKVAQRNPGFALALLTY